MSPSFQQEGTTAMQPTLKAMPNGMHTITPHMIVRDAARAVGLHRTAPPHRGHGYPLEACRGRGRRGDAPLQDVFWGTAGRSPDRPPGGRTGAAGHPAIKKPIRKPRKKPPTITKAA
jgi:hypothetical protein